MNELLQKCADLKFERGMYPEAAEKGMGFSQFLEDYCIEKGIEPTPYVGMTNYEVWKTRQDLKAKGEKIPLTAFERQLKAFDINASGHYTDQVGKFYINSNYTVLFPEYIAQRVYAAGMRTAIWPQFVAEQVKINAMEYKKIYLQDTEADRQAGRGSRGAQVSWKQMIVKKETTALEKYWLGLEFSYEELKYEPLGIFNVALDRIGAQFAIDETDDLFYILVNGDGNSNGLAAGQTKTTATTTTLTKKDVITFAKALPSYYQLDIFAGPLDWMVEYWDVLSDMQNPVQQWGMTGLPLPKGIEWDRGVIQSTDDRFFGVDSRNAVAYVSSDNIMIETDQLIDKQTRRYVVSKRSSFNILQQEAIGALDITWP